MIKILDEKKLFDDVMKNGFSVSSYYALDALNTGEFKELEKHYSYGFKNLYYLIRGLREQGYKKAEILEICAQKWNGYEKYVDGPTLYKTIERCMAKKNIPLKATYTVEMPVSIIEFINGMVQTHVNESAGLRPITKYCKRLFFVFCMHALIQRGRGWKNWNTVDYTEDPEIRYLRKTIKFRGTINEFFGDVTGPLDDAELVGDWLVGLKLCKHLAILDTEMFDDGPTVTIDVRNPFDCELMNFGFDNVDNTAHMDIDSKVHLCPNCGAEVVGGRSNKCCDKCLREKARIKKQKQRAKNKENT